MKKIAHIVYSNHTLVTFLIALVMISAPFVLLYMVAVIVSPVVSIALAIFYALAGWALACAPKDYPGPLGGNG